MKTKRTNRWVFIPVILSFLILAAHFSRNDQTLLMIVSALLPIMLIIKTLWARLVLQVVLVLGALEWVWSTLDLIEIRKGIGEELERNVAEAVDFHLESIIEDGDEVPKLFISDFEFDYRLNIQDFFQLFKPVKQSVIAQRAGINPSLLRQYARGIKHPSLAQAKKIEKAIHQLGEELLRVQLV